MSGMVNAFGNFSRGDREANDYYATHPSAVYPLFDVETFSDTILEPACGGGTCPEPSQNAGMRSNLSIL